MQEPKYILTKDIFENPDNIRKTTSAKADKVLDINMEEFEQFLPIKVINVDGKWMLRSGHRRFRTLKNKGKEKWKVGKEVIIDNNADTLEIENYVENKFRLGLHVIEDADGLLRVLQKKFGDKYNADYFTGLLRKGDHKIIDYVSLFGESNIHAIMMLQVTKIPDDLKKMMLKSRSIKLGVASSIARYPEHRAIIKKAIDYLNKKKINTGAAQAMIRRNVDVVEEIKEKEENERPSRKRSVSFGVASAHRDPIIEAPIKTRMSLAVVIMDMSCAIDTANRYLKENPDEDSKKELLGVAKKFKNKIDDIIQKCGEQHEN